VVTAAVRFSTAAPPAGGFEHLLREEFRYLLLKPFKKTILISSRPGNWGMFAGKFVGIFGDKLLVAGFQADRIDLQGPGIADFGAIA
jgi:hypothetical protein